MVSAATKQKVQSIIDSNPVAVFSKSYCPYCKASKESLSALGAKPYVLELDQIDDGAELQDALQEITGQRTVPQNFIGHTFIGGNSDLQARKSELPHLLKAAGAI
ncbi:thioredoxin-like protein [Morchella snyderi]|nr:thioredoxin-like protein [Morchella snyderi]